MFINIFNAKVFRAIKKYNKTILVTIFESILKMIFRLKFVNLFKIFRVIPKYNKTILVIFSNLCEKYFE